MSSCYPVCSWKTDGRIKKVIRVKLLLEYKHVPFQIEIDGLDSNAFDIDHLGKLIDQVKRFIDGMLRD